MQHSDDFQVKLDAAREWEKALSRWIRGRGWYVLPTYDYSGKGDDKAPKLYAPHGLESLVLPDLQCFRLGSQQWLECKWKHRSTFYEKGGYRSTGICRRLYRHYRQVQDATGAVVVVCFIHEHEKEMRGAPLSLLDDRSYSHESSRLGRHGMRFWRYDTISRWGDLAELGRH